jgi:hypothetical protein
MDRNLHAAGRTPTRKCTIVQQMPVGTIVARRGNGVASLALPWGQSVVGKPQSASPALPQARGENFGIIKNHDISGRYEIFSGFLAKYPSDLILH